MGCIKFKFIPLNVFLSGVITGFGTRIYPGFHPVISRFNPGKNPVYCTFSSFFAWTSRSCFSLMATALDDKNVTDYPLDSPQHADNGNSAADVPPITQEELIGSGKVPEQAEKKKKATDDATTVATKKPKTVRKKKKVTLPPAAQGDNAPRYYYDIQNFIVTNGVDLEQFGIAPAMQPPSGVKNTANGKRVTADPPANSSVVKQEITTSASETISAYTYPGKTPVSALSVFCPDCGIRIKKHREGRGTFKGEICLVLHCPQEIVA